MEQGAVRTGLHPRRSAGADPCAGQRRAGVPDDQPGHRVHPGRAGGAGADRSAADRGQHPGGPAAPGVRAVPGAGQRSAEVGVPGEPAGPQRGAVLPAADRAHLRDAAGGLHPDGGAGDRAVQPGIPPDPRGLPLGRPPGGRRDRPAEHRSRAETTSTCWWPPTPRASSASATRASAASRSPSASSRSTRRPPASIRAGCCRWCWTWAPTTSSCSMTTCTWAHGMPGSATSGMTT